MFVFDRHHGSLVKAPSEVMEGYELVSNSAIRKAERKKAATISGDNKRYNSKEAIESRCRKMELKGIGDHVILRHILYDIDHRALKLQQHGVAGNYLVLDPSKVVNGYYQIEVNPDNSLRQYGPEEQYWIGITLPELVMQKGYVNSYAAAAFVNEDSCARIKMFLVPDQYLIERYKGILPILVVGEHMYSYDGQRQLLLPKDNVGKPIALSGFCKTRIDLTPQDEDYTYQDALVGYYNPKTRQLVDPKNPDSFCDGVVELFIPTSEMADPIGAARRKGLSDLELLSYREPMTRWSASLKYISPGSLEEIKARIKQDQKEQQIPKGNRKRGLGL